MISAWMIVLFLLAIVCNYLVSVSAYNIVAEKIGWGNHGFAWIPVVNQCVFFKAVGWSPFFILLLLIPFANVVIEIILLAKLFKVFGLNPWTLFLILIPIFGSIYLPIRFLCRISAAPNNYQGLYGVAPNPSYDQRKAQGFHVLLWVSFWLAIVLSFVSLIVAVAVVVRSGGFDSSYPSSYTYGNV